MIPFLGGSLRARSIALVLATLIPLLCLGLYWLAWEARGVRAQLERETQVTAALVAAESGRLVGAASKAAGVLAELPALRTGKRAEIEALFRRILATSSLLENILAVTPEGHLLASAVPAKPDAQVAFADRSWFQAVVQSGQPALSGFLIGRITGTPNAFVAHPVRDPAGRMVAIVGLSLHLATLNQDVAPAQIKAPVVWAVVDGTGVVLLHSEPWGALGKPLDPLPGMHRAEAIVPGTPWRAIVGISETVIAARVRQALLVIALPAGLILVSAAAFGFGIARGTWRPLQNLTRAVRRIGEGASDPKLPVEAGGEVGELAGAFQGTLETLTRRQQELSALLQANQAIGSSLDLEQILQTIVRQAALISGAPAVRLFLLEDDAQSLRCRVGVGLPDGIQSDLRIPMGGSFSGEVAATGEPLAVADCRGDPRLLYPEHATTYGLLSYLGLPVKLGEQLFGVLVFNTPTTRTYPPEEIAFHAAFARQAALAIQNARLYTGEQERRRQLEAIRGVSVEITRELDLTALLDLITRRAMELLGAAAGSVYLWDEAAQLLVPHTWTAHEELMQTTRLRLGEGLVGMVAERREGLIVNDYQHWAHARPVILEQTKINAAVAEPLLYRDRLVGVINLDHGDTDRRFSPQDRWTLALLAAQASVAIENARLYADLKGSYATLEAAQEELVRTEKLRALGQMSAGIAHDLNNMLAAVLGQVELLRFRVSDPEVRAALDLLETSATDGAHVVRRLQDFARQRASTALAPVALGRVVREALEITRPRWKDDSQRHGHVIEIRTAVEDVPPVLGEPTEIREVLTNIILNAVDAMPTGGTLSFSARRVEASTGQPADPSRPGGPSGEWVELCVSDTGVGMTEAVRQRIFDPFFTTKG
ncbi:MAG TPA: GAF domain-containing protein, partial [Candidatus Acidoferrum sp.]|nr:GAF domain-containing protein [Candidatus Acidoferrum sp.]